MLKKFVLSASFLLLAATDQAAQAQEFGTPPPRSPVTSPYLNLLNNNTGGIGFNYYRRIRPEQEFRRNDAQLSRSLQNLRVRVDNQQQVIRSQLGASGHATSFLNTGRYFPSRR